MSFDSFLTVRRQHVVLLPVSGHMHDRKGIPLTGCIVPLLTSDTI